MKKKRRWLIKLRLKKNLNQIEMSKFLGITQQSYSYYENYSRRPSPQIAKKIAKILDFDWTKFYE